MNQASNQAQKLFEEISAIKAVMNRSRGHLLHDHNLTKSQLEILLIFIHKSHQTVGEIGAAMGITNGAATQSIEHLVQRKLAERFSDNRDRRVTHIRLTPEGKKLTSELRRLHSKSMSELLSGLPEKQMQEVLTQLKVLKVYIESSHDRIVEKKDCA